MAVTRAPGTTAPVESFTVPVIMPRSPCASSAAAVKTETVTIMQIFVFISETSLFSLDLPVLVFMAVDLCVVYQTDLIRQRQTEGELGAPVGVRHKVSLS